MDIFARRELVWLTGVIGGKGLFPTGGDGIFEGFGFSVDTVGVRRGEEEWK